MSGRVRRRSTRVWLLAAMAAGAGTTGANPPPLPDEFLEYLGSWEADDSDWLVASATAAVPAVAVGPATVSSQPAMPAATTRPAARTTTTSPRQVTESPAPGTERKP